MKRLIGEFGQIVLAAVCVISALFMFSQSMNGTIKQYFQKWDESMETTTLKGSAGNNNEYANLEEPTISMVRENRIFIRDKKYTFVDNSTKSDINIHGSELFAPFDNFNGKYNIYELNPDNGEGVYITTPAVKIISTNNATNTEKNITKDARIYGEIGDSSSSAKNIALITFAKDASGNIQMYNKKPVVTNIKYTNYYKFSGTISEISTQFDAIMFLKNGRYSLKYTIRDEKDAYATDTTLLTIEEMRGANWPSGLHKVLWKNW